MNWLNSLRDQLPLLMVLSPVIGFVVTLAAARTEWDLIRPLAVSNSFCTLFILTAVVWQFERELVDYHAAIRLAENQDDDANLAAASLEVVRDTLDKQRAERIQHQWFSVDGINLWPTLVLIVLTGVVVWPVAVFDSGAVEGIDPRPSTVALRESPHPDPLPAKLPARRDEDTRRGGQMFVPVVLLFEALSLAALTSCDLKVFLLASGTAAIVMSAMIGAFGGLERRWLAERFLFAQFAGGALIMLGFAMLVVSSPWMRIEDSPTFPVISSNLGTLVFETQKWASRNELAFQYQSEVFPWMLLILCVGFAIQFGLFPFHSWLISVLCETRREIAVLCLAGTVSVAGIGWHRFVVPLAPDLLVGFERLILIPALGGAVWGSMRALVPHEFRRRVAFLFLGLTAVSLLGCYCFTTIGMCGAWLMQQQLILVVCALLTARDWAGVREDRARFGSNDGNPVSPLAVTPLSVKPERDAIARASRISTWTLILLLCLPALGLFASNSMIVSELLRDSLSLVAILFVIGVLVVRTVHSMFSSHDLDDSRADRIDGSVRRLRVPLIAVGLLAVVVNLFPSWMLHHCEPEFDRMFRRFERPLLGK